MIEVQWEPRGGPFTYEDPQASLKGETGKGVEVAFPVERWRTVWVYKVLAPWKCMSGPEGCQEARLGEKGGVYHELFSVGILEAFHGGDISWVYVTITS